MLEKKVRHAIKDDRWWVLNRPASFIGAITMGDHDEYILDTNSKKLVKERLSYVPALVKIINEIIDNAVDILKNQKRKATIDVRISNKAVQVTDNGEGIPIKMIPDLQGNDIIIPKSCWGLAKAGSNFNDDELDATTIGTNGVGSYACNVWSTVFTGRTCDGKKEYTGTWRNNDTEYNESIKDAPSAKKGTTVYFEPDLKRFGLTELDDTVVKVIRQRIINLSILYKNIAFTFNKEKIKYSTQEFMKFVGENGNIYETEKYSIGVFPSDTDDFEIFSLINGLNITSGTHIDYVLKYVQTEIKEKLPKKFNKIKPGDIKNKLKIVFIGNEFPTIIWDGQTKEKIKNSDKDIRLYLGDDWKEILPKIAKNKNIIEPITFLHAAKLDAEEKKLAANADKILKKSKVLKVRHASKEKRYLMLTEGDSALKGIIKALGRSLNGFFPLRGVVANPYTNNIQKIIANAEYKDLMTILGLKFSEDNTCLKMNYQYVVLTTDADVDGAHIQGLLMGFFYKFVPDIFEHKKILILRTPIKVAKDKKENMVAAFITEQEYNDFMKIKSNHKYSIEYKKGLGSLNPKEYSQFFTIRPFEECLVELDYSQSDLEKMVKWLEDDANFRKNKIQNRIKEFDIGNI